MSATDQPTEDVILIHGLAAHRWMMIPLAWRIGRAGFRSHRYGYRSMFGTIPSHAARFSDYLQSFDRAPSCSRFHVVAHSLGSIITRQVLLDRTFEKLGRVVMLAPPNNGSPAATRLSRTILPLCTTLGQLSDQPESYVRKLGTPSGTETGIVTASYDFVVTDASSRLASESDRVRIYGGHNGLLVRQPAAMATIRFLQQGKF